MEFIVGLFLTIMTFNFWAVSETADQCDSDIVDIYYPPHKYYAAYDWHCPYTKTLIDCKDCSIRFIRRSQYNKFAKSYKDLGMAPPFPKRQDLKNLYQPKSFK